MRLKANGFNILLKMSSSTCFRCFSNGLHICFEKMISVCDVYKNICVPRETQLGCAYIPCTSLTFLASTTKSYKN